VVVKNKLLRDARRELGKKIGRRCLDVYGK